MNETVGDFLRITRLGARYQAWCEFCEEDKPWPIAEGPSLAGVREKAEKHEKGHQKKARVRRPVEEDNYNDAADAHAYRDVKRVNEKMWGADCTECYKVSVGWTKDKARCAALRHWDTTHKPGVTPTVVHSPVDSNEPPF